MGVLDPKVKKILVYAGIGALLILFLLLFIRFDLFGNIVSRSEILLRRSSITSSPSPSPTSPTSPTPTPLPLAPGKQVYSVRSDSKTPGPAISEATFDPLDAKRGEKMTVQVKAVDASSISVTMIDDSGKKDHTLALVSGVWSGSWSVESTHNRIYAATVTASNTKGEKRSIELWFR